VVLPETVYIGHKIYITDIIKVSSDRESGIEWAARINSENNPKPPKCKCGCKGRIIVEAHHRFPSAGIPKYIDDHRFKKTQHTNKSGQAGAEAWAKKQNESQPICQCGCGEKIVIRWKHRYLGIPKYRPYHASRMKGKST